MKEGCLDSDGKCQPKIQFGEGVDDGMPGSGQVLSLRYAEPLEHSKDLFILLVAKNPPSEASAVCAQAGMDSDTSNSQVGDNSFANQSGES